MKITCDKVVFMRCNSHKIILTEILYHKSRKTDCMVPRPFAFTPVRHCLNLNHLHDHWNGLYIPRMVSFSIDSFPVRIRPNNWHNYVDGVLQPVILRSCLVRPCILVARMYMYRRLPLGNLQRRRNVRLQELEQVAKVPGYERCFSLDHRTTIRQGNLWSL